VTADAPANAATTDSTANSDHRIRFESEAIPYMRQMYPAAVRLTGERCDAEDLIQETFARAYVKFHQFTPGTNLRAWLYCIMFRTFCTACRRRSRGPAEVLAADLYRAIDCQAGRIPPSSSAETEVLGILGDSAVMRALSELPQPVKTVIYLADIQGYRQSDIADIMRTPVGTVMSRLHRGRRMLASKLRPLAGSTPPRVLHQSEVTVPAPAPPAPAPAALQAGTAIAA
jgi:RNA polymerase sigma-70 factor, ECF subfamily